MTTRCHFRDAAFLCLSLAPPLWWQATPATAQHLLTARCHRPIAGWPFWSNACDLAPRGTTLRAFKSCLWTANASKSRKLPPPAEWYTTAGHRGEFHCLVLRRAQGSTSSLAGPSLRPCELLLRCWSLSQPVHHWARPHNACRVTNRLPSQGGTVYHKRPHHGSRPHGLPLGKGVVALPHPHPIREHWLTITELCSFQTRSSVMGYVVSF